MEPNVEGLPAAIPQPSTPSASGSPSRVGFCGLGLMGKLMARNLASHLPSGYPPLLAFNRDITKAHSLAHALGEGKVNVARSLEQIVIDCDIIITNLANDEAVKSVYMQFAQALKDSQHTKAKIFVETSTIYPTVTGELDSLITGPHTHFISAQVFGAPPAADAAQLVVVMAGDFKAKREVSHLLVPAVARKVIDLGGNVEKAPMCKLIGNSLILGSMEIIGECMALADKTGVGAEKVDAVIKEIMPGGPWTHYSTKMLNDQFDGTKGFAITNGLKDASHILSLASEHNSPMPAIDVAHQHLLTARALHKAQGAMAKHEVLDWSALIAGSRVAAGLDGLDSGKNLKVARDDQ